MRTIIAGSRNIFDYNLIKEVISRSKFDISEIISGNAKGVDRLGEKYGREELIPVRIMPAFWALYGKKAGFYRNYSMALYSNALIAIWDGSSSGTKHMINIARKKKLKIYIQIIE